jgi:hypothetical protein
MACCIAVIYLFSLCRRAAQAARPLIGRLTGGDRRAPAPVYAPVARRVISLPIASAESGP